MAQPARLRTLPGCCRSQLRWGVPSGMRMAPGGGFHPPGDFPPASSPSYGGGACAPRATLTTIATIAHDMAIDSEERDLADVRLGRGSNIPLALADKFIAEYVKLAAGLD